MMGKAKEDSPMAVACMGCRELLLICRLPVEPRYETLIWRLVEFLTTQDASARGFGTYGR
ncbi:hypothetical protein CERZMDRAFT_89956 [Cercospora zeae-maydis SCOH1-5]|uniref:Uncharacterized protein n=1 Tax=Cercospora zeae-maydis SCOH1-5 TaxID=717836 RepID=A0A6A6FQA5_9PEZI|nr:hypothetical protein CERZMDRAFT_89956 [Cercospora zeae-maydis SCOH1-5]